MDNIHHLVRQALRRLHGRRFLYIGSRSLGIALSIAALAILARKIWAVPIAGVEWSVGWLAGSVVAAISWTLVWLFWTREESLDAALEIDRRFQLKERVSSCLALTAAERETEMGQSLIADTARRIGTLELSSQFSWAPGRRALSLPLMTGLIAISVAAFLPDAKGTKKLANTPSAKKTTQVKRSTDKFRQELARQQQLAADLGLKDANDLFKKLESDLEKTTPEKATADRRESLMRLNDMAQAIKKRRDELGGRDQIRQALQQLNAGSPQQQSPLAKALKSGDYSSAIKELARLRQELERSDLSAAEKEQLSQQLSNLQRQLNELAENHQQAKNELQRQIEKQVAAGNGAAATDLQRQLDQLMQQDRTHDRLSQLAQQLGECARGLKEGGSQTGKGGESLAEAARLLEQAELEQRELDMLTETLGKITDAKQAMHCKSCEGYG